MTPPDRRRRKQEALEAIRAVETVLRRWDPLDLAPGELAPRDECDSYAPPIVSLLAGGRSAAEVADHLEHIRTAAMGLAPDRARDLACAGELLGWWRHRAERTPTIRAGGPTRG